MRGAAAHRRSRTDCPAVPARPTFTRTPSARTGCWRPADLVHGPAEPRALARSRSRITTRWRGIASWRLAAAPAPRPASRRAWSSSRASDLHTVGPRRRAYPTTSCTSSGSAWTRPTRASKTSLRASAVAGASGSRRSWRACARSAGRSTPSSRMWTSRATMPWAADDRPGARRRGVRPGRPGRVRTADRPWRAGYVPREGIGPVEAVAAIRAAGGLPVLAHFSVVEEQEALVRELIEAGLGGWRPTTGALTPRRSSECRRRRAWGSCRPVARTSTATSAPMARRWRSCGCRRRWFRPSLRRLARGRTRSGRELPVLEFTPPVAPAPRAAVSATDARVDRVPARRRCAHPPSASGRSAAR